MKVPDNMNSELKQLWKSLVQLHHWCRNETQKKYKRINPFYEDLFDWSERGSFWTQERKSITIYNSATLIGDVEIGDHSWIGPFCLLDGGGGLSIGRFCSVSTGCQLLTHDTIKWALSGGKLPYDYERTQIGDCCFLGSHAIVTKGVTVGSHCLIAAGTVVTEDVNDYLIVGGVPARTIGRVEIDSRDNVNLVYDSQRKKK